MILFGGVGHLLGVCMRKKQCYRMHRMVLMMGIVSSLLVSLAAHAQTAEGSPVTALGTLNGVALACGQPALSARIRELIVSHVSRDRETGVLFETATTDAFLNQGKEGVICPDGKSIADQIENEARLLQNQTQKMNKAHEGI